MSILSVFHPYINENIIAIFSKNQKFRLFDFFKKMDYICILKNQ